MKTSLRMPPFFLDYMRGSVVNPGIFQSLKSFYTNPFKEGTKHLKFTIMLKANMHRLLEYYNVGGIY